MSSRGRLEGLGEACLKTGRGHEAAGGDLEACHVAENGLFPAALQGRLRTAGER